MSRSADRMRTLRARRQRGRVVLAVEVPDVELAERLVAAGFLDAATQDDRVALGHALERLVDALVQGP
jgi:hypothetical protein